MLKFNGKKHESDLATSVTTAPIENPVLSGTLILKLISANNLVTPIPSATSMLPPNPQSLPDGLKRRESMMRKEHLHLPYTIITFDRNEIVVDAISGSSTNPEYRYSCNFDVTAPGDISLSAFLRTGPPTNSGIGSQLKKRSIDGPDIFLASTTITPTFDFRAPIDKTFPSLDGTGTFRLQITYKPSQPDHLSMDDFELLKVIGKGTFGKVMQVRKKDTGRIYAIKSIKKAHIISKSEVTHTLAERIVLAKVLSPFIVPLKFSFQSKDKLFLVLSYINGGELFYHLSRETRFSVERTRFYAAQLVCALESLHEIDVIYRDLKPENILIDYRGDIALCDFGLVKSMLPGIKTTSTFCGTPEYLAPELILGQSYEKTVDWWSYGTLLFEMLSGLPPFYEKSHQTMYRRIINEDIKFTSYVPADARTLITGLLKKDAPARLGSTGALEIKNHPFFASIDWEKLSLKQIQAPWRPSIQSAIDTSNHDEVFTNEAAIDSVVDTYLTESMQAKFEGFSFAAPTGFQGESLR